MKHRWIRSISLCLAICVRILTLWPDSANAQANQEAVKIGLNVPLSGTYKDQGQDEERGYRLAIEQINARGGVLGKRLDFVVNDTQSDPARARQLAYQVIDNDHAVMVSGGVSSAVAIAQADVCQEKGIIYMAAITHSNATTGYEETQAGLIVQKAHRHTFRWFFNAWMTSKALVPYLAKRFDKGAGFYYITSDYTWGHSLEESMRWGLELGGCDTLGAVRTPLGSTNFAKELEAAMAAKPDALVLVLFGQDMVTALTQAQSMGLKKKMKIIVPLIELHMAHSVGTASLEGVIASTSWYWGLQDRFQGTRSFVNDFRAKHEKPPGIGAASAWVAIHEWADAVERAKDFSSSAVIPALEDHTFVRLKGTEKWQAWDHQAMSSVYVVEGKSPTQSTGEWDLLHIVAEVPGETIMQNREENPVMLEPLPVLNATN
jgi:ABC-type branched-subunit amino acid transport system substrate-binding protein